MSFDDYDNFFKMHLERVQGDTGQLVQFAVRFFRLVCYPEKTLEEMAKCPGDWDENFDKT